MKKGRMQAKDIQDRPVLEFLAKHAESWCTWGDGWGNATVQDAMSPGTPGRLQLAKMRSLIKRGLADGCPCGCRGDFEITLDGLAFLRETNEEGNGQEP